MNSKDYAAQTGRLLSISVYSGYINDAALMGRRNTCFENIGWTTRDFPIHSFCGKAIGATRPSG